MASAGSTTRVAILPTTVAPFFQTYTKSLQGIVGVKVSVAALPVQEIPTEPVISGYTLAVFVID
jgi:hypothetical protein